MKVRLTHIQINYITDDSARRVSTKTSDKSRTNKKKKNKGEFKKERENLKGQCQFQGINRISISSDAHLEGSKPLKTQEHRKVSKIPTKN